MMPSLFESAFATVLFPEPLGPSSAILIFTLFLNAKHFMA
jgi:hypothetical protein